MTQLAAPPSLTAGPGADGEPSWDLDPGDELVGGVRGWERLGVGLRCEAWLGWSEPLWCPVVVKLARPHQVDHPRARASLQREAGALGRLHHPAAPRLLVDATAAPLPYVVLEHLDGPTLAEAVDEHGPFTPAAATNVTARLLSVLTALHAAGFAHLDVKPENVVLLDGRAVLLDFGSARALGHRQPAGRPVGTVGYAAPEMEACEPVSASMDVFGVGRCLLEMLTGVEEPAAVDPSGLRGRTPLLDLVADLTGPDRDGRRDTGTALRALASAATEPLWPAWAVLPGSAAARGVSPGH